MVLLLTWKYVGTIVHNTVHSAAVFIISINKNVAIIHADGAEICQRQAHGAIYSSHFSIRAEPLRREMVKISNNA